SAMASAAASPSGEPCAGRAVPTWAAICLAVSLEMDTASSSLNTHNTDSMGTDRDVSTQTRLFCCVKQVLSNSARLWVDHQIDFFNVVCSRNTPFRTRSVSGSGNKNMQ